MTDKTSPVAIEQQGEIALLRLDRPARRNAVNDAMIEAQGAWFAQPPEGVKVVVLAAAGERFSAGLDLAEQVERSAAALAQTSDDAKAGLQAFLARQPPKFGA
jgi:enoyl-CoA hydratase/carnithine racemase